MLLVRPVTRERHEFFSGSGFGEGQGLCRLAAVGLTRSFAGWIDRVAVLDTAPFAGCAALMPPLAAAGVRQPCSAGYDGRGSCHSRTPINTPPTANRITPLIATNTDTLDPEA